MGLYESVRAVTSASGDGPVDWDAVTRAAKSSTDPGSIDLSEAERAAYAADVRDARDRVREVGAIGFDLPETVEIQNRHHWIDANVVTFQRVAAELAVDAERFRRWIAFHEVAHAAEFGAAPWLGDHLEEQMEETFAAIRDRQLARISVGELNTTMTAVEGYAELVMDRAFDDEYADLRAKVDARRRNRGPVASVVGRLLGLGMKRRQYERGKAFFEAVADARDVAFAARVWERPENLPSDAELDDPARWLARMDA